MRKLIGASFFIFLFYACSVNNIREDESLSKYFKQNNVDGTFAMFDNMTGEFTIYNIKRFRDSTFSPAATFKIINSLIGIETGRIKDSTAILPWDNDFHELALLIGKDTMQHWLDTLGYGQRYTKPVIKGNLDTFWLDNSLKVTADEQLGLVKKLYFGQLPFQARSQRMVKNVMLNENNSNYKLSYKTGWGHTVKGNAVGWLVGWIEENRHPYFFVLQLESPRSDYNMSAVRLNILKSILRQYGFMEGKR